jgi:hypothetical protein
VHRPWGDATERSRPEANGRGNRMVMAFNVRSSLRSGQPLNMTKKALVGNRLPIPAIHFTHQHLEAPIAQVRAEAVFPIPAGVGEYSRVLYCHERKVFAFGSQFVSMQECGIVRDILRIALVANRRDGRTSGKAPQYQAPEVSQFNCDRYPEFGIVPSRRNRGNLAQGIALSYLRCVWKRYLAGGSSREP